MLLSLYFISNYHVNYEAHILINAICVLFYVRRMARIISTNIYHQQRNLFSNFVNGSCQVSDIARCNTCYGYSAVICAVNVVIPLQHRDVILAQS